MVYCLIKRYPYYKAVIAISIIADSAILVALLLDRDSCEAPDEVVVNKAEVVVDTVVVQSNVTVRMSSSDE